MKSEFSDQQREVQNWLEGMLTPGEKPLAYTTGKLIEPGSDLNNMDALIGLTSSRLILSLKKGQKASLIFDFPRSMLKSIKYAYVLWKSSGLQVQIGKDAIFFRIPSAWVSCAKELAKKHSVAPVDPGQVVDLRGLAVMKQVNKLRMFGMNVAAHDLLKKAMQEDLVVANDPAALDLRQEMSDLHLSMRVAAGFYLGYILLMMFLALLGSATINPFGLVVAASVIFGLWSGKKSFRTGAWWIALVAGLLNLYVAFTSSGSIMMLDTVIWLAYPAAMIIVLTGKSTRLRLLIGTLVYLFGFVGVTLLAFMMAAAEVGF